MQHLKALNHTTKAQVIQKKGCTIVPGAQWSADVPPAPPFGACPMVPSYGCTDPEGLSPALAKAML